MKIQPTIKLLSNRSDLNLISFFLLILSDIFIAVILFYGLSQQINQFTDEYEYFPNEYRSMLINNNWVENNVIEKISAEVLSRTRSTYENNGKIDKLHPICREISELFKTLENDPLLIHDFAVYERLQKNYNALNHNEKKVTEGILIQDELHELRQSLENNPDVKTTIDTIFANQKMDYTKEIQNFRKLFALKRTLFDFIFLLPVLAAFILWNRKSVKREKHLQTIISSHYILVAFLPIFFESIRLIIEVIPKIILKTVYDFLLRLNLISLWYYAVLVISISFIVLLIWVFQTKIFTKEKYRIKLYEKHKCMTCNTKIDYKEKFCPACGSNIYTLCSICKKETIKFLPYCIKCGCKNNPGQVPIESSKS